MSYSGANNTSTNSTVDFSETNAGEEWACIVTPNDGEADGDAAISSVTIDSDWAGAVTFTPCGATGRYGPSQSECNSAYSSTISNEYIQDGSLTISSGINPGRFPLTEPTSLA